MLATAGTFIGLFYEQDWVVAAGLAPGVLLMAYRKRTLPWGERRIFYLGILLSAGLGTLCEYWGVSNQYWTYHGLDEGRHLPAWLPFAWGGAFGFLYSVEHGLIRRCGLEHFSSKLLLVVVLSAVFPTIGEIITIQLGVWTYAWDYQIFGVPALAIVLLTVFHTGIYLFLRSFRKMQRVDQEAFRGNLGDNM